MIPLASLRRLVEQLAIDREFYPSWETLATPRPAQEVLEAWARQTQDDGPMGAYLHVPFCSSKCAYCHFPSHRPSPGEMAAEVGRLETELALSAPSLSHLLLDTLYVGGGTPSLLPADQLHRLLGAARQHLRLGAEAQLTVEISPLHLDPDRARVLTDAGVNRVSMGVQSLDPKVLQGVNRGQQTTAMVQEVVETLRAHGISNICTDLMVGLPGQDAASFLATVGQLLPMDPDVIHVYPFEARGSVLAEQGFEQSGAALSAAHAALLQAEPLLLEAGYSRVFNETVYARDQAMVNRYDVDRYLHAGSVASFGDASYGHIFGQLSYAALEPAERHSALDRGALPAYLVAETDLDHEMREHLAFTLKRGVDLDAFEARFGAPLELLLGAELAALEEAGWVARVQGRLEPRFASQLDTVAAGMLFIPEPLLTRYVWHVAPDRAQALLERRSV